MDIQRVIENLKHIASEIRFDTSVREIKQIKRNKIKSIDMAIKALEKQIPIKPVIKPDKYTDVVQQYHCPKCGRYFGQAGIHNVILFNKEKYCQGEGCGQAIDWSEDDSEEEK